MATIVVTHGIPAEGFHALKDHTVLIPPPLQVFSEQELCDLLPQAEAVVAGGPLPGHVIRCGKKLRIIANYGAGYDSVDIRTAAEMGIPVTAIPDTTTHATAELAVGLMLSVARRIGEMTVRLRQEKTETLFGMGRHMGQTLEGKTLGIVGMGRIGARMAEIAQVLGMRVVAYNRRGQAPAGIQSLSLDEVLQKSDVVSLHCPLNEQSLHLINRERLAQMKPGAILINTARGKVVDHDALLEALQSGHLSGAGLDVFPEEPNIPEALKRLPQVVLSPHAGTNTRETRDQMAEACAERILAALSGQCPEGIVNGVVFHSK